MKRLFKGALIAAGALTAIKGLDNRLELTRETVYSPALPDSFDGFKIAHLSDYHNDFVPGLIEEVCGEKPDLIVCTGDMADDEGSYEPALRLMQRIREAAPVMAVTGNHDLWRADYDKMEEEMTAAGVKFLHTERVYIRRGEDKISIAGIDDPFSCEHRRVGGFLKSSIEKLGEYGGFEILLFHRANLIDEFSGCGFDLILSGHMHGGHIRLPFLGGVASPTSSLSGGESLLFPKYFGGRYEMGNTVMIVSRGLGNPTPVPRIFNRPELVMVTLRKKK